MSEAGVSSILVVDDERSAVDFIARLLKSEGFEVVTATSGYLAFNLLNRRFETLGDPRVSLLICDWSMEGWDGIRLLHEIRRAAWPDFPKILISGKVTQKELELAARSHVDGVLIKPIKKNLLIQKVRAVMAAHPVVGAETEADDAEAATTSTANAA